MTTLAPRRGSRPHGRALLVAGWLAAACLLGPGGAVAHAEEPLDLRDQVTDRADVLSPDEEEAARAEVETLRDETGLQLFVVFVDTFTDSSGDPVDGPTWAQDTSSVSRMGDGDLVLAVAVQDRLYGVGDVSGTLPPEAVRTVQLQDIEPALRDSDWAGAVTGAVTGFEREYTAAGSGGGVVVPDDEGPVHPESSGGLGSGLGVLLFAAPVVVFAGAGLVTSMGKRRRRASSGTPVPPSAQGVSLPDLQRQAAEALVGMDNAVRSAQEELAFAEAQFGTQRTEQFRAVLEQARAAAKEAFSLRQQLDDDREEPEDVERSMLARIIELTGTARSTLDEHTQEFTNLRALQDRAPEFLAELRTRLSAVHERLPVADQELAGLSARYPAQALVTLREHRAQAEELLRSADGFVTAGGQSLQRDDRPSAPTRRLPARPRS
ncbi:MAG: hypothetical protein DCC50_13835 [Acidobacteria bacterium]|nr:MAG: hypothetical protein DCC50_13835 [Acidobacteriota bacterium]